MATRQINTYREFAASPVAQFSDDSTDDDDNSFSDFTFSNLALELILLVKRNTVNLHV